MLADDQGNPRNSPTFDQILRKSNHRVPNVPLEGSPVNLSIAVQLGHLTMLRDRSSEPLALHLIIQYPPKIDDHTSFWPPNIRSNYILNILVLSASNNKSRALDHCWSSIWQTSVSICHEFCGWMKRIGRLVGSDQQNSPSLTAKHIYTCNWVRERKRKLLFAERSP